VPSSPAPLADLALLLPMGLAAGVTTTVAGLGGGFLLLVALSLLSDPLTALAATTPALLLSNVHRAFLFRRDVDGRIARAFALGAVPGGLAGGFLAGALAPQALHAIMLVVAVLGVTRAVGWWTMAVPPRALVPAGLVVGAMTGTSGGAGILAGPVFLAAGLRGDAYVGTIATAAVAMHSGRLVAYGVSGSLGARTLAMAAVLFVALAAGNLLGRRVRRWFADGTKLRVEVGALVLCIVLSLVGVGR
jgi:uncharacterized membrane protein YfcA